MGLPSEMEEGGGIGPALFNSFYMLFISLLISIPLGMAAGIYLAEFAPNNKLIGFVRICVEGLASVPSIIFGLFGIAVVRGDVRDRSYDSRRSGQPGVPEPACYDTGNRGSDPCGAERNEECFVRTWRNAPADDSPCSRSVAMNGIITGICLVAGRAFGESAVIILTAGVTTSGEMWDFNLLSPGETLAVHLWYVQSEAIVPDAPGDRRESSSGSRIRCSDY